MRFRKFHKPRLIGGVAVLAASIAFGATADANENCDGNQGLWLINGKIHTMDSVRSVVSSVLIRDGKFAVVGKSTNAPGRCTNVINLRGRTVVPAIIDNHVHILLSGVRPGHETRSIETAFSIAEVQAVINKRAAGVPPGRFITAIGGLNPRQFAENRLPTLTELDAATSEHPGYIHAGFAGPSTTNSLGKVFLENHGVTVATNGAIAPGGQSFAAFIALNSIWGFEDKRQTTLDVIAYFNSVGITTAHSVGGSQFQGPGFFDPENDYNVIISLAQEDKVNIRLRMYFNALDSQLGNPTLTEIIDNRFPNFPEFGDIIKKMGVGEHLVSLGLETQVPLGQIYEEGAATLAESGLQLMEHSFDDEDHDARADVWGPVGVDGLRWSVDHANTVEVSTLDRLAAIGAGVRAHGAFSYLSGNRNGPPYRRIVDHGIRVGTGSDSAQAAAINPWLNMFYMVTGRDSTGALINDGQQVSREEALWLYTAANGWFSKEEDKLGSIEVGKLGDIVVLSDDYFNSNEVSDEQIKRIHSVFTVVGGKIVHDAGVLSPRVR